MIRSLLKKSEEKSQTIFKNIENYMITNMQRTNLLKFARKPESTALFLLDTSLTTRFLKMKKDGMVSLYISFQTFYLLEIFELIIENLYKKEKIINEYELLEG